LLGTFVFIFWNYLLLENTRLFFCWLDDGWFEDENILDWDVLLTSFPFEIDETGRRWTFSLGLMLKW
jgi:hypothetical protein